MSGTGEDLRTAGMRAARWVAVTRVVVEIVALAATILIAHLLTPAEVGRAVIALIAIPLSSMLLNGAISPLLIQRPEMTDGHLRAASALGIAGGALLSLLCLALAPLFAALIDHKTGVLVALAAPAFLISGLGVAPDAMLRRRLDFRVVGFIEIAAALGGTAVSVTLALLGVGERSLVAGSVAGVLVGTVAVCWAGGLPRPAWHGEEIREILRLGAPAAMAGLGAMLYRRVDYVIVGARLGAADVGAYWRAYQLGAEYQSKLTTVMLRVAFPLYSRIGDLGELRRIRGRVVRLHGAMVVPPLALLIATAPVLVPFVFGEPWRPAVVPTQILAGVGMCAALMTGVGPLLLAVGRTDLLNRFNWTVGAGYAVVIYLAAPHGLVAVSVAGLGYAVAGFFVGQELLVRRPIGIPWSELGRETLPAFVVAGAVAAVAAPVVALLDGAGSPAPLTLLAAGAAAAAVYVLLLPRVGPAVWADLRALAARRGGPVQAAPSASASASTTSS